MSDRLFVYGTLQFPAVMRAVAGRLPDRHPAVLEHHACYLASHGRFPGLVAATGDHTTGLLYLGVDAVMLRRLDEFESSLFERRLMTVSRGARRERAWVYLLAASQQHLLGDTRFDVGHFEREELPRWLTRLGLV